MIASLGERMKSDLPGMIWRRNRGFWLPRAQVREKTRLALTSHTRYEYAKESKGI